MYKRPKNLKFSKILVGTHMGSKASTTNFKFWPSLNFFLLLHTQFAAKKPKTFKIRGQMIKKWIWIKNGSLSIKNGSEKFSRLGTCNMYSTLYTIFIKYVQVHHTFYLLQAEQHRTGDLKCKEINWILPKEINVNWFF
jgi:hypothetical protein